MTGQHLVPIVSWFGRCSTTPTHRRWRYPAIDLSTAVVFGLLAWHFGSSWQLLPYLAAFAVLVVLGAFDLEAHLLLNILTRPLLGATLVAVLVLSTPNDWNDGITAALVGGLTYWLLIFVPHLVYPRGMGFGDVKLAPTLGLLVGWTTQSLSGAVVLAFWAFILGNLSGGLTGLALRAIKGGRVICDVPAWFDEDELEEDEVELFTTELPFGPFLILGALIAILASGQLA